MERIWIGVDPGLSGGIAAVSLGYFDAYDTPTIEVKSRKKTRKRHNLAEMIRILLQIKSIATNCEMWLELVSAMPKQGVSSMFSMGRGFGNWEMAAISLQIPLNYVSPVKWKHYMLDGQGKEKSASVYRAQQLFPSAILTTPRGRLLDGRAEALLIAEYGRRQSDFQPIG